jgi:hypothetical protein
MAFSVVIDGHNFINDLHRNDKDTEYVLRELSLPILHDIIQERMKLAGMYSHPFIHAEFVCSGSGPIGNFKAELRNELLVKLKNEIGVTVREVPQHTQNQKEVDLTVFIRMLTLTTNPKIQPHHIVLFSSDTDFVPAIQLLTEQGTHVVIVGFKTGKSILNEALINESYLSLDLADLLKEMEKRVNKV